MRSPAELRIALERGARLLAYAALAAALIVSLADPSPGPARRVVPAGELPALLAEHRIGTDSIFVAADTALDPVHRDWLAATGAAVRWGGSALTATAASVEPLIDPAGGHRVSIAAPPGTIVHVADAIGPIDSVRASGGGATLILDGLVGDATAVAGRQRTQAGQLDSVALRRAVVFGRPSWETKFVVTALEERGWLVDARIPLAPDAELRQGVSVVLDTARVSAVVALDGAAAAHARAITAFVRQGGGLVLGPDAAGIPSLAPRLAGSAGRRLPSGALEVGAAEPRRALPLAALVRLADGAVPLETRDRSVAVAARRPGAGRVVQIGYYDTWRWRMTGPDGAVDAHRRWWSSLVGTVAHAAERPAEHPLAAHDAPLARMTAAFGPPDTGVLAPPRRTEPGASPLTWWLGAVALASLLSEWTSRRLRGAR